MEAVGGGFLEGDVLVMEWCDQRGTTFTSSMFWGMHLLNDKIDVSHCILTNAFGDAVTIVRIVAAGLSIFGYLIAVGKPKIMFPRVA